MVTFWFFLFVTTAALHNTFGQNPCPAFPPGGRCGRSCSSNLSCQLPQRCICNIQCGKNCNFPPVRKCLAPDIEFGFATYASLTVGSSANYYCRDDYQLRGSTTRICQIDLSWSGDDPLCIQTAEICYEQPPALTNGRYVYVASAGKPVGSDVVAGEVDWSVGDRMEYRCNNGYFLNDTTNPVWTCTETGDWMGKPLSCIPCVKVPPDSVCGRRRCSGQRDCLRNEVCSCSSRQCGGRFCIQPYCTRPENIENGYITGHVHNFPSDVITYSCHEGYRLDNADATRTCLTNGQWSLPDLKCIKRGDDPTDCPTLPGIVNGYILYENQNAQSVGSVAIYICFNAYVLTGTSSRTCLPGGKWSGEEPHCSADFCYQNPPDLTNGRYVFVSSVDTSNTELALTDVDWKVGDRMEYRCNQGFYLNDTSNPIWTCTKSGTWTGKSLSCIACIQVRPGTECGRRRCSGQGDCFSHEVCSCSSRQCGGRFCIQPYCTKPNSLANGYITGSATGRVGDTITYFCYNGYRLNTRSSTRSCLRYGTWSGEEPFCIERGDNPVRCPILRNVKAASLTYSDGQLEGSEATYRCNSVSRLVGAGTRTCLATGVWSGAEPKCVPIILFCTSPPYLVHGRYQASPGTGGASIRGYRVGQVIQYTCDVGFEINTVESRKTCLEDGTWSGPTLTCSRKAITRCPIPTLILNGVVSTNGVNPGSAQYSCNPGYELYGNRLRECLTDGTWSGEKPTCVQNVGFCNNPPSILNGWYKLVYKDTSDQSNAKPDTSDVDLTRYGVGQMVEYGCRSGFQLNSAETKKTCLRDGSWSGSALECTLRIRIQCPFPRPLQNGDVEATGVHPGATIQYSCNSGYEISGDSRRRCLDDGTWSGQAPTCVQNVGFCNNPPSILNGWFKIIYDSPDESNTNSETSNVDLTRYGVGAVVEYGCRSTYQLNSADKRKTCLRDGNWSGSNLECILKKVAQCPLPPPIQNGVLEATGVYPGNAAHYSCYSGYELSGDSRRQCLGDGTWSGETPTCVQNVGFCNNPPSILNGWYKLVYKDTDQSNAKPDTSDADLTRYGVGQMVEYGCRSGFQLNFAETKKTCLRDGSWSGSSLQCVPVVSTPAVCPMPRPPRNGYIALCKSCPVTNFPGITVGDVLTYECAIGYTLVGRRTRVCVTRTRRWSYLDPLCQFAGCTINFQISNGFVSKTRWLPGSKLNIHCSEGYRLSSSQQVNCVGDGQWSASIPSCVPFDDTTTKYEWLTIQSLSYMFVNDLTSWYESMKFCSYVGGWLATSGVRDFQTYQILKSHMLPGKTYWFGLTDKTRESYWMWEKGELLRPEMYLPALLEALGSIKTNAPDDDSDCAYIANDVMRSWNDDHCRNGRHYFICEKNKVDTWVPAGPGFEQLTISGEIRWLEALARCRSLGGWLITSEQEKILAGMTNEIEVENQNEKPSKDLSSGQVTLVDPVCERETKHSGVGMSDDVINDDDSSEATSCGDMCETNKNCSQSQRCSCDDQCGFVCKSFEEAEKSCCLRRWTRKQCGGPRTCTGDSDCSRRHMCICNGKCGPTCTLRRVEGKMSLVSSETSEEIANTTTSSAIETSSLPGGTWRVNFYSLYERTDGNSPAQTTVADAAPVPNTAAVMKRVSNQTDVAADGRQFNMLPTSNEDLMAFTEMNEVEAMVTIESDAAQAPTTAVMETIGNQTEVPAVNRQLNLLQTSTENLIKVSTELGVGELVAPGNGCNPSPCENNCECVQSCKHTNGYFCKPSGDEAFLGRNCSHPPPYVECRNDSVMVLKVSKSLMREYDMEISNGVFYVDSSGPANNPLPVSKVNGSCQLLEAETQDSFTILLNLQSCGTEQLYTGPTIIYMNRIWWDRLTENGRLSFTKPVAEVSCTYPTVYHVQSAIKPFCCDPVPRKTDFGTFLLRSALHKNPPGSGKKRIPVNPDQRGIATYTVGEMIYLTVTLDLGPRMAVYSDDETRILFPRFTMCWLSPGLDEGQPDDSLIIYPNDKPAFDVWGPDNNLNVADIGFEVIRWTNPDLKFVYIHCMLQVYTMDRAKRSTDDNVEYSEIVVKGPFRIVTPYGDMAPPSADNESAKKASTGSLFTPLLIAFVILFLAFVVAMVVIARLELCTCHRDPQDGSSGTLDFN